MSFKIGKTAAVALSLFGTLSLCGCGANLPFVKKMPDFSGTYTVTADITYDKLSAKADITRVTTDEWEFKFTEPKQLNGLTVTFSNDRYFAALGGLAFSADENPLYAAAPQIITQTLTMLSDAESDKTTSSDGVLTFSDELDGKRVTVTADERTGDLISLKCPYRKLSVNFSDQKPYTLDLPESGGVTVDS